MKQRKTCFEENDKLPGPGSYETPITALAHGKGTSFGANKVERFVEAKSVAPGPGSYTTPVTAITAPQPHKTRPVPVPAPSKAINWVRKTSAPSIPATGQNWGYEEEDDGSLVPQPPPIREEAEPYGLRSTLGSKGVDFARSTAKRVEFKAREGPGPGAYELATTFSEDGSGSAAVQYSLGGKAPLSYKKRPTPSFQSKLPRYHELIPKEEQVRNVPGPGSYALPEQFKSNAPAPEHQFFGSTTKRPMDINPNDSMAPESMRTPGPGTYEDVRGTFSLARAQTEQRQVGAGPKKVAPFGGTSERFRSNANRVPGPGAYANHNMDSVARLAVSKLQSRRGAFGTCGPRFKPKKVDKVPGPGAYAESTVRRQAGGVTGVKKVVSSAAFVSGTARLSDPVMGDGPPPGAYTISRDLGKKSISRSQANSTYKLDRGVPVPPNEGPGPGQYNLDKPQVKGGGLFTTKDSRFKDMATIVPGPGAYTAEPSSLHKPTYNVTLAVQGQ